MFWPKLSESQIHKALLSFQLYQKVCNSLLENFHGTITHHSWSNYSGPYHWRGRGAAAPPVLADQLTLFQTGRQIMTAILLLSTPPPPGFLDLPTALLLNYTTMLIDSFISGLIHPMQYTGIKCFKKSFKLTKKNSQGIWIHLSTL